MEEGHHVNVWDIQHTISTKVLNTRLKLWRRMHYRWYSIIRSITLVITNYEFDLIWYVRNSSYKDFHGQLYLIDSSAQLCFNHGRVDHKRPQKTVMVLLMEEILHELRLVVYPIFYRVFYIPGGSPDFWTINSSTWQKIQTKSFPSTVGPTVNPHLQRFSDLKTFFRAGSKKHSEGFWVETMHI